MFAKMITAGAPEMVVGVLDCYKSGDVPKGRCIYVGWFPDSGICIMGALK